MIASQMTGQETPSMLNGCNMVVRQVEGVEEAPYAVYEAGAIQAVPCLVRGDAKLPFQGAFALLMQYMAEPVEIDPLIHACMADSKRNSDSQVFLDALEALVTEGWASAFNDESRPKSRLIAKSGSASR